MRRPYLLPLALLLPGCAHAAPPKPNFAALPAYLQALNQSPDPQAQAIRARIASGPADLARERSLAEKAGIATRTRQLAPTLPPAGENAAPLYLQLDTLRKQKPLRFPAYAQSLSGRYLYTPEQIGAVQKEYEARQDVFTLLHEATDKPQCIFDNAWTNGFSTSFTNYAGLREDAREINTESLLLAYHGNYTSALSNEERGFRLAAHTASEPLLVPLLVAGAIDAITDSGVQTILSQAGPDAALDRRAEADLLALPPLPLRHAFSGEAAVADAEFSQLRHATPAELAQTLIGEAPASTAAFTPAEQTQVDALLDAAEADYLGKMRRLDTAADLPRARRQEVFGQIAAEKSPDPNDPVPFVVGIFLQDRSQIAGQADRIAARRLVTAAGASVLAAKAQTGAFPATLSAAFTDPFTNKPLGYRLEGTNGFVIYSAGPGADFDGGKPGDVPRAQIFFRYPLVPVPVPSGESK